DIIHPTTEISSELSDIGEVMKIIEHISLPVPKAATSPEIQITVRRDLSVIVKHRVKKEEKRSFPDGQRIKSVITETPCSS
ncbi:uncharacterized protein V6R79_009100, partial [Siganus canaliculatus]